MTNKNEEVQQQEEDQQDIVLSFDKLVKQTEAFVDTMPVKKEIVWKRKDEDGTKKFRFTVYVRRQNFAIFSNFIAAAQSTSDQSCKILVECLAKDEKGKQNLLTFEEAKNLNTELAILLLNAINEVNTKKN